MGTSKKRQKLRNHQDKLWHLSINDQATPAETSFINAIIRKQSTKKHLANYLYKCCWSPPITTFVKAIQNGNFITWPGLNDTYIIKYFKETPATAKVHLDQERKILQSTKISPNDSFTLSPTLNTKLVETYTILQENKAYCDPTGRFLHTSTRGNTYVFVTYDWDSNAILVEPAKSRQAKKLTNA